MAWDDDSLIYNDVSGDYTNLTDWEAAIDDITPTGDGFRARLRGTSGGGGSVLFEGHQAGQSSSCRVHITAETGYGLQDRSSWTGAGGSGDDAILNNYVGSAETSNPLYVDIYNIEFLGTNFTTSMTVAGELRIYNALIYFSGNVITCGTTNANFDFYIGNALIKVTSGTAYGITTGQLDGDMYVRHVTVNGLDNTNVRGISIAAGYETNNSVVINCPGDAFYGPNRDNYCAADDTTPDGANSIDSITEGDEFTNVAGNNYTVKSASSQIYHSGVGSAPAWFTNLVGLGANNQGTDIVGNDYASTPSMGCFEYVAGGTTLAPTTLAPTTLAPTTLAPTTLPPTTPAPTTLAPTTLAPTTLSPTTLAPTTLPPTTLAPTTLAPTTLAPTTLPPTTLAPTTLAPTTLGPTTLAPTTLAPTTIATTAAPTTLAPTTPTPTTAAPTTLAPTTVPTTAAPTTISTTLAPTTTLTTLAPTTAIPVTLCNKPLYSTISDSVNLKSPITEEVRINANLCW